MERKQPAQRKVHWRIAPPTCLLTNGAACCCSCCHAPRIDGHDAGGSSTGVRCRRRWRSSRQEKCRYSRRHLQGDRTHTHTMPAFSINIGIPNHTHRVHSLWLGPPPLLFVRMVPSVVLAFELIRSERMGPSDDEFPLVVVSCSTRRKGLACRGSVAREYISTRGLVLLLLSLFFLFSRAEHLVLSFLTTRLYSPLSLQLHTTYRIARSSVENGGQWCGKSLDAHTHTHT